MKIIKKCFLLFFVFSNIFLAAVDAQYQYGPLKVSFTDGHSLPINEDMAPIPFKTKDFEGRLVVRVKNAEGASATEYFTGKKRKFSLQVEGRFLREISSERVVFGARFLKPLEVPQIFQFVVGFIHSMNPSFDYAINRKIDGVSFFSSPLISGADRIAITELDEEEGLGPWVYGGAKKIDEKEDTRRFFEDIADAKPWDYKARRAYYAHAQNRAVATFKPGLLYSFDLIQKDAELNHFTYKHSIFPRVDLHNYLNGQPIRLEIKVIDREGNVESVILSLDISHGGNENTGA